MSLPTRLWVEPDDDGYLFGGDVFQVADEAVDGRARLAAAKPLANRFPFRKPIHPREEAKFTGWGFNGKRLPLSEGKEELASALLWAESAPDSTDLDELDARRRKEGFVTPGARKLADEFARIVAIVEALIAARRIDFLLDDGGASTFEAGCSTLRAAWREDLARVPRLVPQPSPGRVQGCSPPWIPERA